MKLTEDEKFLLTARGEFDVLNKYYKKNPPAAIIDNIGIKHYNEIEDPADYGAPECPCMQHPLDSDTWYHSTLPVNKAGDHMVVKKCKKCREILMRKIKEK